MAIADGSQCECTTLFMFSELIWSLLPWSTSLTIMETVKPIPRYYLKQTESSFVLLYRPDLKVVLKLQHFLKLKHFCVISMSWLSFRIILPHPVPLLSCVKVTVLLRKCQTGGIVPTLRTSRLSSHCRLKQTFHRVSGVLIPRTHSFSEHRACGWTKRFRRLVYLFSFLSLRLQLSLPLVHNTNQFTTEGTKGASALDTKAQIIHHLERSIQIYISVWMRHASL